MTRSSNINPRARRWTPLSLLCAPASLLLTLQPQAADASLGMPTAGAVLPQLVGVANRVDGLSVEELDDGTTVLRLQGTAKPTFNVYRLDDPDRLVVDISKSSKGSVVPHVPLDTWACGRVTIGGVSERGTNLVRVVVELKRESSYIVVPDGDALVVTVTPREVAPEQYFARKSAVKRRAELESQQRRTEKLEADATKLKAEANEDAQAAKARAEAAAQKVRSAEAVARKARSAEARARSAEAEAKQELQSAKSNRLAVRRALRKATKEREGAESARKAAEAKLITAEVAANAKRKEAERLLAAAEAVAKQRMAEAAVHRDAAKRELADARGSKEAAAAELEAARAEAAKSKAASKEELAAARAIAAKSRAASEKELARAKALSEAAKVASAKQLAEAAAVAKAAKAEADRAQQAATRADAQTKQQLAEAQSKAALAQAEAERAKRAAGQADADAKEKLAEAEAAAQRAKARALEAERAASRTDADAKERLAQAEAKAKAAKAEAQRARTEASRADADAKKKIAAADKLAKARLAEAQTELTDAKDARAKAKERLADAERRAAQTEAQAQAKAAAILAAARTQAAKEAAAELAGAKRAADAVVAKAKVDAEALKKKRLAEAEADAKAKVARAEKAARVAAKERLATAETEAKHNLAQARKKAEKDAIAQAERELARVREQGKTSVATAVATARTQAQADVKEELVAARTRIEADAARRIAVAEAKAETAEAAAQTKLNRADAMLASASKTLAEAKADRASAQKLQVSAEKKLAAAEQARVRAESEKASAESARKAAELALAQARDAAAEKRGKAGRKANEELADAQRERDAAVARQRAAAKALGSVERRAEEARKARETARKEKEQAEVQLASLTVERDSLKSQLADRDAALVAMKREVSAATQAQAKAEALAQTEARAKAQAQARADAQAAKAAQRPAAPPSPKKDDRTAKGPAKVRDVRFEHDADESRVIVEFDGAARYDGMSLTPTIQLLKFSGAKLAKKLERSLDASKYDGSVRVVTSFAEGDDAKVIVSTHGPVRARLEERPGQLVWHFPAGAKAKAAAPTTVATNARTEPQAVSVDGAKVGGFASIPKPASNLAPATDGQADVTEGRRSSRGRWRGERIDIELQDAPIKDVLLLFSDIGRVNIVAGDGVEGSVTMKLNAVPWDQALDIILRSLKLGSTREGNVVRVATLDALEEEQRQAIERANARVQLKPLETRLVPLSYATVDEMIAKVQSVLSPRGTVTPDSRTNTLIIMDVAANIALAQDLVKSLDTQTPQVLIEARIVEARTTFTRQLGIQWGFDFTASPGTGNPTGLLFPNSIGLGGGGTGTPADTRGLLLPGAAANPNYAVDLPAPVGTGAGGALGMSFGSISGNLNTNLRLSAAESTGEVRIISAPKVVTLDNSEATIEQGVQIPISQVSAQGVNTRFVNATLSLQVTPHVTNEGAVLLDVTVQKNEADFVNTGARGDPTILTRSANSRMLVNDADTAVIGGIYTRNKAVNYTKIPWLADIPIVGWFFKNKSEADTRSEVLIFLTPKIVNRASSIGG